MDVVQLDARSPMVRQETLQKLKQMLMMQRDDLKRKLARENDYAVDATCHGDSGDYAVFDNEQEMHSQLTAFESRELSRIDKALLAIREGVYGTCEDCQRKIPVARLRALPQSTCCIQCQRQQESTGVNRLDSYDWESAVNLQLWQHDQDLTPNDIQMQ